MSVRYKGPEIRLKTFKDERVTLEMGQDFCLTTRDVEGTKDIVSVTHKDLHKDIHVGSSILIDDGLVGLKVVAIKGQDIHCKVENGGTISNRKGVNIPGVELSIPFMSEKIKKTFYSVSNRTLTSLQLLSQEQQTISKK